MELKFENFKVFSKFQHLIISSSKIGKNELGAVEGCAVFKNLWKEYPDLWRKRIWLIKFSLFLLKNLKEKNTKISLKIFTGIFIKIKKIFFFRNSLLCYLDNPNNTIQLRFRNPRCNILKPQNTILYFCIWIVLISLQLRFRDARSSVN